MYLSIYLSIYLIYLSIYMYLSIYLSIYLFIYLTKYTAQLDFITHVSGFHCTDCTVPLARNFPITRACETSDGTSLARNELHASLPLATDAPIISAFLLVCSRVNRESLAKYKFLKRYDAEKKLHCMKLQLIVV